MQGGKTIARTDFGGETALRVAAAGFFNAARTRRRSAGVSTPAGGALLRTATAI